MTFEERYQIPSDGDPSWDTYDYSLRDIRDAWNARDELAQAEIKAAVEAERKAIIDILEKAKTGKYKSESAIEAIRARWSK